ncbi:MAG: AmmeMemoRadiSam system protein B, partial [Candidatus Omnitrophica bacterium]|nr:AmmeMemoRadiSam system protein B [Candidatus Omnitrophota bacterium]
MVNQKIRAPAVAGQFYPSSPQALEKQIGTLIVEKGKKINAIACILPHAGYIYSGVVAGKAYKQVEGQTYDCVVIVGLSHGFPIRKASV